jgi:hypothetical protein
MVAGANDFLYFSAENLLGASIPWTAKEHDSHEDHQDRSHDADDDREESEDEDLDECEDVGTHGPDEPPPRKKRAGSKRQFGGSQL